ncbi:hypothetical protein CEXT_212191 [Caerostris extrusa]|uniref:Uncharacterized protein n=1 Tax=Caerostris extrusa TaxID=172846 RepID=A0AAV4UNU6_CAEEX|nr:hypothetical protein CEXT_212191 [Caerostris extrusa]
MISELIVFLNAMGIPVPFYWFPQLWCYVYNERIRQELLENGGWAMLAKVAEQRCKECKLHGEIAKGSKGVHHAFEDINLGMEIEMEFESFDKYNALEIVGLKRGIMSQDDILKVALDQILVPEASSNLLSELLSN